jgi:hypothetical protein
LTGFEPNPDGRVPGRTRLRILPGECPIDVEFGDTLYVIVETRQGKLMMQKP